MKKEQRKVIDLGREKHKRLVMAAFDKLESEQRREKKDKEQAIRIKAKSNL